MTKEDLLTPQVIGRLGELATEMELLKRGWSVGNYNASTKNAAAYDLFASKGNRRIGIRVKSYKGYKGNSKRSGEGVQYTAKSHGSVFHNLDENDTGDFVVIVRICPGEAEDFYILPTAIVDKEIKESNKKFHEHSKKDGTPRKKTNHRALDFGGEQTERAPYKGYGKIWAEYHNKWDILDSGSS